MVLLSMAAGCSPASEETDSSDGAILGGMDVQSAALDAVGSLMMDVEGVEVPFCTGTLIAPNVVLTAKHCVLDVEGEEPAALTEFGTVTFAVGFDAGRPKQKIRARGVEIASFEEGGVYGSDVAAYILESPVRDVTPLEIGAAPLTSQDIGASYVAVGYGVQDRWGSMGTRKIGNVTLSMLAGQPYPSVFDDFDAYASYLVEALMYRDDVDYDEETALEMWETTLFEGHEAFFAPSEGDVQVCDGDSGGPLLRKVDGQLKIFGVASWVLSKEGGAPCSHGVVYATFGAPASRLLDVVLARGCGDVSSSGRCEGDVAVRCATRDEVGVPRLTRMRCSDVGLVCGQVEGAVGCVDPVTMRPVSMRMGL